jgi:hypothetical protein
MLGPRKVCRNWLAAVLMVTASFGVWGLSGCQQKEKVVDIEAPGVDVEVERDVNSGAVEVETNRD